MSRSTIPSSATEQRRAGGNFDGLRLLGALLVLVSHQAAIAGMPEPSLAGVRFGTVGVMVFFSISGYLVTASWQRDPHLPRFFVRRALRIWPALAACLVASMALVAVIWAPSTSFGGLLKAYRGYSPNFVFAYRDGNVFPGNPIPTLNNSLWTIPLEVQSYLALAVCGFVARKWLVYAVGAIAAAALALQFTVHWPPIALHLPGFFQSPDSINLPSFFLIGALVYLIPILQQLRGVAALTIAGVTLAFLGYASLSWACILPPLVLSIGNRSWPVLRNSGRFGDLSYGIYLWAWPVQQVGVAVLGKETPYPILLSVTLAIVIPIAAGSWHLIEKRSMSFKPRVPLLRPTRPPATAEAQGK